MVSNESSYFLYGDLFLKLKNIFKGWYCGKATFIGGTCNQYQIINSSSSYLVLHYWELPANGVMAQVSLSPSGRPDGTPDSWFQPDPAPVVCRLLESEPADVNCFFFFFSISFSMSLCLSSEIIFIFTYLISRDRVTDRASSIPAVSLPRCLQWPGLGWAQARRHNLNLSLTLEPGSH